MSSRASDAVFFFAQEYSLYANHFADALPLDADGACEPSSIGIEILSSTLAILDHDISRFFFTAPIVLLTRFEI